MTPDGFAWVSDIEMQVGNHLLDLHGEYLFRSVTYDIARRSVTLQWARRQEDHVDPELAVDIAERCGATVVHVIETENEGRVDVASVTEIEVGVVALVAAPRSPTDHRVRERAPSAKVVRIRRFSAR